MNILEAILEAGLGDSVRLFEASSCEIFGKSKGCSCDEESAMHPQSPYGKAKLLAHLAVKHYRCFSPLQSTRATPVILRGGLAQCQCNTHLARPYSHGGIFALLLFARLLVPVKFIPHSGASRQGTMPMI